MRSQRRCGKCEKLRTTIAVDCCPRPSHRRRPIGREAEHDLPPPLPRRLTKGRARGGRITRTAVEEKTSSGTLVRSKTRRRATTIRSVYGWGGEECCVCIIIFIHATWRGPPIAAAAAARPVDRCRFRVYRHSAAQRSLSQSRLYSVTTKPESTAVVIQGSRLLYFSQPFIYRVHITTILIQDRCAPRMHMARGRR